MRYPVEDTAVKHERIVKEALLRFAAVTWTAEWVRTRESRRCKGDGRIRDTLRTGMPSFVAATWMAH